MSFSTMQKKRPLERRAPGAIGVTARGGKLVITCNLCEGEIYWAKTENGRMMPLEARRELGGNITIGEDGIARVIRPRPAQIAYLPHYARCPAVKRQQAARAAAAKEAKAKKANAQMNLFSPGRNE